MIEADSIKFVIYWNVELYKLKPRCSIASISNPEIVIQ